MSSESLKQIMDDFPLATNPDSHVQAEDQEMLLWVELPFPALVRGVDARNQLFEEQTVLDNLSAHGLSLHLERCIEPGARLFIVVRMGIDQDVPAPRIAVRGRVRRVRPNDDATYTFAIVFTRYRFLYASTNVAE